MRVLFLSVLLVAMLSASKCDAGPMFTNNSFETGTVNLLNPGDVTGWTFSGNAHLRNSSSGFDGAQWAWVGRRDAPAALISQTVAGFTVGATYDLTFLLATESFSYNGGLGDTVNVAIVGASTINQDFTQSNGSITTPAWSLWEQQTYTFVADAATLTFNIHGYADGTFGHNSADAGVDRFNLTQTSAPVPEPTSLAIFGIGALGAMGIGRRKRKQTA